MSKRKYDRGARRRMRVYEDSCSLCGCSIEELIEAKCMVDPEFKKAWEEYKKADEGIFKNTMRGLCEAIVMDEKENNMNRVAKFSKVSQEQFKKDVMDLNGGENQTEEFIQKAYDSITLPVRKTKGSAGYDFASPFDFRLFRGGNIKIPTGIRCEIKEGWVLKLYVRSSIGFKRLTLLANGTGIIDEDYAFADNEGHIMAKLVNHGLDELQISAGDSFMQGVFVPYGITEDDDVDAVRTGGIGSTGK